MHFRLVKNINVLQSDRKGACIIMAHNVPSNVTIRGVNFIRILTFAFFQTISVWPLVGKPLISQHSPDLTLFKNLQPIRERIVLSNGAVCKAETYSNRRKQFGADLTGI